MFFKLLCNTHQLIYKHMAECKQYFSTALFTFGEFGQNDYSFMLQAGVGVQEVRNTYVPQVVQLISAAVEVITPVTRINHNFIKTGIHT